MHIGVWLCGKRRGYYERGVVMWRGCGYMERGVVVWELTHSNVAKKVAEDTPHINRSPRGLLP